MILDMPTTKLLYSKDVPNYKKWVAQYYGDIQKMNEIPPDDFANYLQDENRMHQGEFNSTFAVKEIYSYAVQVRFKNLVKFGDLIDYFLNFFS